MKAYVDSSVVLRAALGEKGRLAEWSRIDTAITSEIATVECLRALDRLRLMGSVPDRQIARRRATVARVLEGFEMVRLNRAVLSRAADAFPTLVRTLDAIHLSSALFARMRFPDIRFATHDEDLASAAEALAFRVIGAQA